MNTELTNNAADSYAMLKTSHFSRQNFYKRALKQVLFVIFICWQHQPKLRGIHRTSHHRTGQPSSLSILYRHSHNVFVTGIRDNTTRGRLSDGHRLDRDKQYR